MILYRTYFRNKRDNLHILPRHAKIRDATWLKSETQVNPVSAEFGFTAGSILAVSAKTLVLAATKTGFGTQTNALVRYCTATDELCSIVSAKITILHQQ